MFRKIELKSDFTRHVLTLMTGTTVAQAIPIAISPVLTRIYTPKDFGIFAIFFALTTVFGSLANARYELAIMLPKDDEDAINIAALGILIALALAIVLLVIVSVFNEQIARILGNEDISHWLYFVPLSVFFVGLFNVLTYFNSRTKQYADIRNATILKSIILSIVQIVVGILRPGVSGLVLGEFFSRIFANNRLAKNIIKDRHLISSISLINIKKMAIKYRDFPKFSLWAILFNNLSYKSIDLSISSIYSVATLGFYALTDKVLGAPIALIGKSIGQVYFQQASNEYNLTGSVKNSFISTVKKTTILSSLFFGTLFFVIEYIFIFAFGEAWRQAGLLAKYMMFLYFCRFITVPLLSTPIIVNKVKVDLVFQFLILVIVFSLMGINFVFKFEIFHFLIILSIILGLYYLFYAFYIYFKVVKKLV